MADCINYDSYIDITLTKLEYEKDRRRIDFLIGSPSLYKIKSKSDVLIITKCKNEFKMAETLDIILIGFFSSKIFIKSIGDITNYEKEKM